MTSADHTAAREPDLGGNPACWLNRVCEECGRFVEDQFAHVCPACGTPRSTGEADPHR